MRNSMRFVSVLLALSLAGVAIAAENKAVQTMAGILTNLKHMPSAEDKQALTQIADDKATSANERTLAQALMNVQHMVGAADKPKLEAIANDAKASNADKTLANIILNLKHFPTADDKEKLKALSQ